MSDALTTAGAKASHDLSGALLTTAGAEMQKHEADPNGPVIIATGFFLAIRAMDQIDPAIRKVIIEMLRA